MGRKKKSGRNYIDNDDLMREWANCLEEDRASDKLAQYWYTMIDHLLMHYRFNKYPEDVKDEMKSYAIWKFVKYWQSYNPKKGYGTCFNYSTMIIWNAFLTVITKYYKRMDMNRELLEAAKLAYGI